MWALLMESPHHSLHISIIHYCVIVRRLGEKKRQTTVLTRERKDGRTTMITGFEVKRQDRKVRKDRLVFLFRRSVESRFEAFLIAFRSSFFRFR